MSPTVEAEAKDPENSGETSGTDLGGSFRTQPTAARLKPSQAAAVDYKPSLTAAVPVRTSSVIDEMATLPRSFLSEKFVIVSLIFLQCCALPTSRAFGRQVLPSKRDSGLKRLFRMLLAIKLAPQSSSSITTQEKIVFV